jgi:inner membrane transporter RhtA
MASSRSVVNGIFGSWGVSSAAPGSGKQVQHAFEQPRAAALPAHVYFIISAVFHYMGPAFAVLLFAHVDLLGVAWLRIASAALIFAVWKKPWRYVGTLNRQDRRTVLALGLVLAAMNVSFYLAISRVPLGTVAAIEFLGPIGIAAAGARTRRNGVALVLAVLGVYFLRHLNFKGESLGYLFAFVNCAFFALYILLGHRAAAEGGSAGIERLSAAMSVALLAVTPVGIGFIGPAMLHPKWLLAGVGVGVCSSVIPYVCDQFAMARLKRSTFALLLSILPATASVMGVLILRQLPSPQEIAGICLVMAGVGVQKDGAR